jgi:ATP-dependent DNA helicase RecG
LAKLLGLESDAKAKDWLGRLQEYNLISSKGKTKGVSYFVSPKILQELNFTGVTTLKKIESHRLRELIREDLSIYEISTLSEIHKRIGSEISVRSVRLQIENLLAEGIIMREGINKGTKYRIVKKQ